MPIYAYRCTSCGHAQDVLQKMSDAVLTECPACHAATYAKQLTAAGFQLKGSGWYVTDFRGGNTAKPDAAKPDADAPKPATPPGATPAPTTAAPAADAKPAAKPAAAPASAAPAPSASSSSSSSSSGR